MSFGFVITKQLTSADFTNRSFVAPVQVAITTGTYPTGGVGPLALAALFNLGVSSAVPTSSQQNSVASPPSGYVWCYDATTDKLRAFVQSSGGSGSALAEFSGSIASDTVDVVQVFSRQ